MAEKIREMSPDRQHRIRARADELIAEELALQRLREGLGLTPDELADRLEAPRDTVTRPARHEHVRLAALRGGVEALGGELHVTACFADRPPIELIGPVSTAPRGVLPRGVPPRGESLRDDDALE